jgi:hypothetical protein
MITNTSLCLSQSQYAKLYSEIFKDDNDKDLMESAKLIGAGQQMRGFLIQLKNSVKRKTLYQNFKIDINVADELACSDVELASEFSRLFFSMIASKA